MNDLDIVREAARLGTAALNNAALDPRKQGFEALIYSAASVALGELFRQIDKLERREADARSKEE